MSVNRVRKYPRTPARFTVECLLEEKTYKIRVQTLGGGGLFLIGGEAFPVGTQLRLQFRLQRHLPPIEVLGRVCYTRPPQGIGIEFLEIRPEDRHRVLRFIQRQLREKRAAVRATLATQIESADFMTLALARDISAGGLFIETERPLEPGNQFIVRFRLEETSPVLVVRAEAVYQVEKFGMGVQFLNLPAEDRQRIEEYVAKSQASPLSSCPAP